MVNIRKLKGKIVEEGMSIEILAEKTGITKSTFYRRISDDGDPFTIKEADIISKALNLNYSEVMAIFFNQYVA